MYLLMLHPRCASEAGDKSDELEDYARRASAQTRSGFFESRSKRLHRVPQKTPDAEN